MIISNRISFDTRWMYFIHFFSTWKFVIRTYRYIWCFFFTLMIPFRFFYTNRTVLFASSSSIAFSFVLLPSSFFCLSILRFFFFNHIILSSLLFWSYSICSFYLEYCHHLFLIDIFLLFIWPKSYPSFVCFTLIGYTLRYCKTISEYNTLLLE